GSGVATVEYSIDNGAFTAYSAPFTVSGAGAHTVRYRATDVAGNVSQIGSSSFTIVTPDTTAPTVAATLAGTREGDNYTGTVTVTVTATDNTGGSGVASIEYSVDNGAFTTYTSPIVVTGLGAHTVRYRATDVAGNVSQIGSSTFTIVTPAPVDTTPPTVSATLAGTREGDNYTGTVTVTVTATDGGSGVASVEVSVDNGAFTAYTSPVAVTGLGAHTVRYRATDNAGNVSPIGSSTFTIVTPAPVDTTPPTVSASLAGPRLGDDYTGPVTVTVTATDGGSGVASVEYSVDNGAFTAYTAPVTVSAVGAHTVRYRATDNAGNVSPIGSSTFTIVAADTTAPTVSATLAGTREGDNYTGAVTVTLTATDAGSGVASVEYSIDNGAFTTYSSPFVVTGLGAHTVRYRATDVAGNVSAIGSNTFTIVTPAPTDTTPPTVSAALAGPQSGGNYTGPVTVTLTATDNAGGSGVASVEYSIDNGSFVAYLAPFTVTAAGQHTVRYRATDVAGNVSTVGSSSFTIVTPDTTAPTVNAALSGPQSGGNYTGTVTVTLTATDNAGGSGVASVEYSVDNGAFTAYTAPITVSAVGAHTVRYRATDVAGNVSQIGSSTFTIVAPTPTDTTAPTTNATQNPAAPNGQGGYYTSSVTVTLAATDNSGGSGVDRIEYKLDGAANWTAYTGTITVSADGQRTLVYRAVDKAGNVEADKSISFRIDATDPVVTVTGLVDGGSYDQSRTATVSFTATDAGSGVGSTTATLDGAAFTSGTTVSFANLSIGSHTLVVTSRDAAGNDSSTTVRFTVTAVSTGTTFATLQADMDAYVADGELSERVAASLEDRLSRAAAAAERGSEKSVIRFLQEFVARANNQIKGDAQDYAVRDDLVASARELIAKYETLDEAEGY
ncbi:beta strand repeat-containing protein, partial [Motilibacter deserti]